MLKLKGVIKKYPGGFALIVYSKNLVEKVEENNKKVGLKRFEGGFKLEKKNELHAVIGAEKWIQITVTKLINKKQAKDKKITIYLDKDEWGLKNVFRKGMGSPIADITPEKLILKKAAIRTNNRGKYFLDLSIKRLYELAKKETIKCLLNRKEEIIIIRSEEPNARKLTPHGKRRIQICIPEAILNEKEKRLLSKKSWFSTEIKMNIESFNLKIEDFYGVREEKEMVRYLIKKNIKVKIKNISDPYDFYLPEYFSCIEVHNSVPGYGDLVTRHKVRPAMVRLRILEAIFSVNNTKIKNFFLIINKGWSTGKYIKELTEKIDKRVHIIYTNFENEWYEKVGEGMINKLNSGIPTLIGH